MIDARNNYINHSNIILGEIPSSNTALLGMRRCNILPLDLPFLIFHCTYLFKHL
jgi:hypothetical protein